MSDTPSVSYFRAALSLMPLSSFYRPVLINRMNIKKIDLYILILVSVFILAYLAPLSFVASTYLIIILSNFVMHIIRTSTKRSEKDFGVIAVCISSFSTLWIAFSIGGIISKYGSYYPFQIPFYIYVSLLFIISIIVINIKKPDSKIVLSYISHLSHSFMIFPFLYVIKQRPSGDYGPASAWGYCIGLGSILAIFESIISIIRMTYVRIKTIQKIISDGD
jgi:hypothetical protein